MSAIQKHTQNQNGFSMIELLIASVIGIILLGVTIIVFTKQQSMIKHENEVSEIGAKGRHAIRVLMEELRMAGYGLPPNEGITAPDPLVNGSTITFRSNLEDIKTTTPPAASGTAVSASATQIDVIDNSDFSSGDNIVIYQPGFENKIYATVNGTPSGKLGFTGATGDTASAWSYATNARLIQVSKYNTVTIQLSGTQIQKIVDGTTTVLIGDVDASVGLAFDFLGETEPSSVRKLGVTIKLPIPERSGSYKEFKTDITLRNIQDGIEGF